MGEIQRPQRSVAFRTMKAIGFLAGGAAICVGANVAPEFIGASESAVLNRAYMSDLSHHYTAETEQEQLITRAVQRAFGQKAMVRCADMPAGIAVREGVAPNNIAGSTTHPSYAGIETPTSIRMQQTICNGITGIMGRRGNIDKESVLIDALSVGTLAHEVGHLKGIVNESQANCFAIQTMRGLATALDASPAVGRQLHDTFVKEINNVLEGLDPAVQEAYSISAANCYDGGPWDITPNVPNPQDFPKTHIQ